MGFIGDLGNLLLVFDRDSKLAARTRMCTIRWSKYIPLANFFEIFDDLFGAINLQENVRMSPTLYWDHLQSALFCVEAEFKADGFSIFRNDMFEINRQLEMQMVDWPMIDKFKRQLLEAERKYRASGLLPASC